MRRGRIGLAVIVLASLGGCDRDTAEATVELGPGTRLTMELSGAYSLHSDWKRLLRVAQGLDVVEAELLMDTGWWRGSNLYQADQTTFVLFEGQVGCLAFSTSPPEILPARNDLCIAAVRHNSLSGRRTAREDPADRLVYLGHFIEADETPRLRFESAEQRSEPVLPDPI